MFYNDWEHVITMKGKRIVIEPDEGESCDSYATDMAIEKVQHLVIEGFTSGNSPLWYIKDMGTNDER